MTGRERILTALRGGRPDRVPAAPLISADMAARAAGRPLWALQIQQDPPPWRAVTAVAKDAGVDIWLPWAQIDYELSGEAHVHSTVAERTGDHWVVRSVLQTPDGDLSQTAVCPRAGCVTLTEKYIKDFRADFPRIRHLFAGVRSYDDSTLVEQRSVVGETGVVAMWAAPPGPESWAGMFHGGPEAAAEACDRHPDLAAELAVIYERHTLQRLEAALEAGVECVFTGHQGPPARPSPGLFATMTLPSMRRIAGLCREMAVPCGIRWPGAAEPELRSWAVESGATWIAGAPAPADPARGPRRAALMGGVPARLLWRGSAREVRAACLEVLLAAGVAGGYVLSGNEACDRETPVESLREMATVAAGYGGYPLDAARIREEMARLDPG